MEGRGLLHSGQGNSSPPGQGSGYTMARTGVPQAIAPVARRGVLVVQWAVRLFAVSHRSTFLLNLNFHDHGNDHIDDSDMNLIFKPRLPTFNNSRFRNKSRTILF